MSTIGDLIKQLELFSPEVIDLEEPISQDVIKEFESKFNFNLPNDYKAFLSSHNGFSLMGLRVYGIQNNKRGDSLEASYLFEHFEAGNPMPGYLVPFSPDGSGNHYCFDLHSCDDLSCKIVFWQHDYFYSDDDQPEITNPSFTEWVKEIAIEETLEDFDYSGNRK